MTVHCTNPEIGRLLHAYELGALDGPDLESFERHLLNCDACFHSLQEWEPRVNLLREESDFAHAAETAAREHNRRLRPSVWARLWPHGSPILLRPGAAYLLALVLLVVLLVVRPTEFGSGVFETQVIYLASTRDGGVPVYAVSPGEPLVVSFHLDNRRAGRSYAVKLTLDGTEMYAEPVLKRLDKLGTGTLLLSPGVAVPGVYRLLLLPMDSASGEVGDTLSFTFGVELPHP